MRMIALDLEASLIDNAITGNPRPGLFEFLTFCLEHFDRVALLTTVEEQDAREVLYNLADSGAIPEGFVDVEYISWEGEFKDLRFVKCATPDEILFLDDDPGWVHPAQVDRWVSIPPWISGEDNALATAKQTILSRTE